MPSAILRSGGRIAIPAHVRDSLGLNPGDRVDLFEVSDGQFAMGAATRFFSPEIRVNSARPLRNALLGR
jgi:AbrB family looped-hinge helix DNA binding protein